MTAQEKDDLAKLLADYVTDALARRANEMPGEDLDKYDDLLTAAKDILNDLAGW